MPTDNRGHVEADKQSTGRRVASAPNDGITGKRPPGSRFSFFVSADLSILCDEISVNL